jgi:hyperosmotically inducible periplasmic protein
MHGNERSVCFAQAKAAQQRAEAGARAKYQDSARAKRDARVAEAKADYAVARAKCADKSGGERKACVAQARAVEQEAITSAMRATQ